MDPVVSQLEEIYPQLSPGERAVARLLLDDFPFAALGSLRALAERAGVSAPTASRLVDRLGYQGFAQFQAAVRVAAQEDRSRLRAFAAEGADPRSAAADLHNGLTQTIAAVSAPLLESAADALVAARTVWTLGGPLSELAADYLARQLGALRPAVRFVGGQAPERARSLLDVTTADLVVAYDFRRYSTETAAFARAALGRGAQLLLVTDAWGSPLAGEARILVPLPREASGPIAPLTHEIAVTELLLVATASKLEASERLEELDALTRALQHNETP
jgi:DNA-binding MurR/RpiR family transcriptional regulator